MKKRRLTKTQKKNIETEKRLQKEAWDKLHEKHKGQKTILVKSAPKTEIENTTSGISKVKMPVKISKSNFSNMGGKKIIVVPSLAIKRCIVDECGHTLVPYMLDVRKRGKAARRPTKRCELCDVIYIGVLTYHAINKEGFDVANTEKEIEEMYRQREEFSERKQRSEMCIGTSSLDKKRYIGNSMERSFVKIDTNKLKEKSK